MNSLKSCIEVTWQIGQIYLDHKTRAATIESTDLSLMFHCHMQTLYFSDDSSLSIWTASVATSGGGGGGEGKELLPSNDINVCPSNVGDFENLSSTGAGHSKWTQWNTYKHPNH